MSVKQNLKYLANNSNEMARMASQMIPHIKKRLKKYSDDELRDSMKEDDKMNDLAEDLYSHLPTHIKIKVKKDDFFRYILMNKEKLMKKKSAKKKVYG